MYISIVKRLKVSRVPTYRALVRRFFHDTSCTRAYVKLYLSQSKAALRDERIFFGTEVKGVLLVHLTHHNLHSSPSSIMTTIVQVKEAIAALKDRTGSSVVAISKWLESEKKVSALA